ncbi:uncharacterized protein LOC131948456 [Physella acuta]|uniref:uncharacterized protein LOC131948456 n=1 Tax=Physella acuta TaxID=109671 RepID=UPI0027DC876A|nr:uncharacterized protein LOC131948456 [Physella acuta]
MPINSAISILCQRTNDSSPSSRSQPLPGFCQYLPDDPSFQPHNSTIIRISFEGLQVSQPGIPFRFYVDSTIYKLIIKVNSSDPLATTILDPSGTVLNTRVRKSADTIISTRSATISRRQTTDLSHVQPPHPPHHHQLSPSPLWYSRTAKMITRHTAVYNKSPPEYSRTSGKLNNENILKSFRDKFQRKKFKDYYYSTSKKAEVSRTNNRRKFTPMQHHRELLMNQPTSFDRSEDTVVSRLKRRAMLMTMAEAEPLAVWEIEPPQTGLWAIIYHTTTLFICYVSGLWAISADGPGTKMMLVTAVTSLEFSFTFLNMDLQTLEEPPIANQSTLARIFITASPCVSKITVIDVVSDLGVVLQNAAIDDLTTLQGSTFTDTGIIYFVSPPIPFYLLLHGYDVNGLQFQRQSSVRVVPRMFVISLVEAIQVVIVPGNDERFAFMLRNRDSHDVFKITVTFDNQCFSGKAVPSILQADQNGINYIAVVASVNATLTSRETGVMTVTAMRMSDKMTDSVVVSVQAMPATYQSDHTPPVCGIPEKRGGCRLGQACHVQHWSAKVQVTDHVTGVKSAEFINVPQGAYTNVEFSYSVGNRSATAEYRFTCCNIKARLEVSDYANNTGHCDLMAQPLPRLTTTSTPPTTTVPDLPTSPTSTPIAPGFLQIDHMHDSTIPARTTPAVTPASHHVTGSLQPSHVTTTSRDTDHGPPYSNIHEQNHTAHNFSVARRDGSSDSDTTQLGLIIAGAIAGVAGLSIVIVCATYKMVHRPAVGRASRCGSDVTMGSSWESQGSSGTDSLRMKRMIEADESLSDSGDVIYVIKSGESPGEGGCTEMGNDAGVYLNHVTAGDDERPGEGDKGRVHGSPHRYTRSDYVSGDVVNNAHSARTNTNVDFDDELGSSYLTTLHTRPLSVYRISSVLTSSRQHYKDTPPGSPLAQSPTAPTTTTTTTHGNRTIRTSALLTHHTTKPGSKPKQNGEMNTNSNYAHNYSSNSNQNVGHPQYSRSGASGIDSSHQTSNNNLYSIEADIHNNTDTTNPAHQGAIPKPNSQNIRFDPKNLTPKLHLRHQLTARLSGVSSLTSTPELRRHGVVPDSNLTLPTSRLNLPTPTTPAPSPRGISNTSRFQDLRQDDAASRHRLLRLQPEISRSQEAIPDLIPTVLKATDLNQLALKQDLQHIKTKLLQFQRRLDQGLQQDVTRRRRSSTSSVSSGEEKDDKV